VTDEVTPSRPTRTWKITWPDGEARTVQGHDMHRYDGGETLHIVRCDPSGRMHMAFVINPAHVRSVEEVTEASAR
jgi:hypothetical protein